MIELRLSESEARTLARMLDVHRRDMPQHDDLAREIGRQMRGQMMPTWHLWRLWETEKARKAFTGKGELEEAVRGKIPTPPPLAFQPTGYVVERVLSAAEQVYASAKVSDSPEYYLVETRAIHNLADALGVANEGPSE